MAATEEYQFLITLTLVVGFGFLFFAYYRTRDAFHPLIFLVPMLAYSYWLVPTLLVKEGGLWYYLPKSDMAFVQLYYLLGISSLCLGALFAGKPPFRRQVVWNPPLAMRRQLRRAGILLGCIGVLAFIYLISYVGGLEEAYGRAHSQGWAPSGYIRESFYLIIPGLLLILMANSGKRIRQKDIVIIALIAAPLVFHGIASASRGPTFMVIVTLVVGWYMIHFRRPGLLKTLLGLAAIGFLMLFLVTHRDSIYLGSDFRFEGMNPIIQFIGRASTGNEYILGSGVVIDTNRTGEYQWGARYVMQTIIRAIPRQVWPTQYEDTAKFFGIEGIDNQVLGDLRSTLGWHSAGGASMGFLADVWKQFWWLSLLFLFFLGWGIARIWRRAVSRGGIWIMVYVIVLVLSVFLTQQTFQSFLFRLLYLGGIGWIVWYLMVRTTWQRIQKNALERDRVLNPNNYIHKRSIASDYDQRRPYHT